MILPKLKTGVFPMANDIRCKSWWELMKDSSQDWMNNPLFAALYDYIDTNQLDIFPWLTSSNATIFDLIYYAEHSGSKHPSIVIQRLYEMENEDVGLTINLIVEMIIQKFADKWDRLYSAITTNYKPLENYDMEEKETPSVTHTITRQTETVTSITDDVSSTDVYGFNSSSPVPNSKVTRNGTSTVSNDPLKNIETNAESGTRDLTRHGNIGVTTSQQMLQSEIDLRNNYNFVDNIMNDVDSIMCLLVY